MTTASYTPFGRIASIARRAGEELFQSVAVDYDGMGLPVSYADQDGRRKRLERDDWGLLKSTASSKGGKVDRSVKREHDRFDRVVKVTYGPGETETFAYDAWGRVSCHTRGKKAETYSYDHFGRLAGKCEDGVATAYAYDAWGRRVRRTVKDSNGEVVSDETRAYDAFGRLASIKMDGQSVEWRYDRLGRVERQIVDGREIVYSYTKHGRLY